ncbi:MAG: DNA-3-methyladenine glycosylase I [Acidobacteriota bacterium]|nr:DNA-3-methyladenine glycosylase I [Acidobacteriota bacterium]
MSAKPKKKTTGRGKSRPAPRSPARIRCHWPQNDLSIAYHDDEWGVPVHDDRTLFEFLILEGAQAGLSWDTVLKKRAQYRRQFARFDPAKVARFGPEKVAALLADPGIIRNRLKIASAVSNAQAFLKIQKEFGSFDTYIWGFVNGRTLHSAGKKSDPVPAYTPESDAMSKDLKKRGFRFVGTTICYAFMQAVGMVNDHAPNCFRYRELKNPHREK